MPISDKTSINLKLWKNAVSLVRGGVDPAMFIAISVAMNMRGDLFYLYILLVNSEVECNLV